MKKRKLRAGALIRIGGALIAAAFFGYPVSQRFPQASIMRSILSVISTAKKITLQVSVPYIVDGEAAEKKFQHPSRYCGFALSEKKRKGIYFPV